MTGPAPAALSSRTLQDRSARLASPALELLAFAAIMAAMSARVLRATAGRLVYGMDDAYIHMAMAKNLALHGTYGVNPGEFASASSSPLWVLLLAASYKTLGVREWIPLAWNVAAAAGVIVLMDRWCRRYGVPGWARVPVVLLLVFLTALVPLAWMGMEHSLHIFLICAMVAAGTACLDHPGRRETLGLAAAAALGTAVRYETLYLAGPLAIALALHGERKAAGILAVAGAAPVLAFGVFSLAHHGFLLPNSLVVKSVLLPGHDPHALRSAISMGLRRCMDTPRLTGSVLLLLVTAAARAHRQDSLFLMCLIGSCAALILTVMMNPYVSLSLRYEAFLSATSLLILVGAWAPALRASLARLPRDRFELRRLALTAIPVTLLPLVLLSPLARSRRDAFRAVPYASRNIRDQQFQTAGFLGRALAPGTRVAVNDLGAVCYLANARVLDLAGLGSIEVARARRAGHYDTAAIEGLLKSNGVELVVAYPEWFRPPGRLPTDLIPLERWTIEDNVVCGEPSVVWYATTPEAAVRYAPLLLEYHAHLPATVRTESLGPGSGTASAQG